MAEEMMQTKIPKFLEGIHWKKMRSKDSKYKYVTLTDIELDLPKPILPENTNSAYLRIGMVTLVKVQRRYVNNSKPVDSMTIHAGYSWDGATGVADLPFVFGLSSLVHDVSYQMGREGIIPMSSRSAVDSNLALIAIAGGTPAWRARIRQLGVRILGRRFYRPTTAGPRQGGNRTGRIPY